MSELSTMLQKFMVAATQNPEGLALLTQPDKILDFERNQVFQFEFSDGGRPFYLKFNGANIDAGEGVTSLDWRIKDWDKATRILTDQNTLKQVILGETDIMDAWHEGKWDFSSRIGNSPVHSWFCILMRLAREQIQKQAVKLYLGQS